MYRGRFVRFGFGIGAALGIVFCTSAATPKTAQCNAVDKLAKVGLRSVDTVTVSPDTDNKICRFAVNGVAASSSQAKVVAKAYRVVIWGDDQPGWMVNGGMNKVPLNEFAALLLAAGPHNALGNVVSILEKSKVALTKCVNALRSETPMSAYAKTMNGEFRCMTVVHNGEKMVVSMGPIIADLRELKGLLFVSQLIVAVTLGSQWNVLIAPRLTRRN